MKTNSTPFPTRYHLQFFSGKTRLGVDVVLDTEDAARSELCRLASLANKAPYLNGADNFKLFHDGKVIDQGTLESVARAQGRPRKPSYCSKCGQLCASTRESRNHCKEKN